MRTETNQTMAPACGLRTAANCTFSVLIFTAGFFALSAAASSAQTAGPDASLPPNDAAVPPPAAPSASPPGAASSPGVMGGFGNWVQQSNQLMQQGVANMQQGVANMQQGVASFGEMVGVIGGQANQATRDAVDAARNAASSVSKLPNTGLTAGHERCVIAPNGAPDCRGAAEMLCHAKGYAKGASVDFVTVETCPPPWRTSPADAPEGACTKEHFVTKALCQ